MRGDIDEAIESARTIAVGEGKIGRHARHKVIALVLGVIRELPDDMSIRDLREELEE